MAPEPVVADALQQTLVDLISLELQSKQAHWNIRGARFRALHLALDEVVDAAREQADTVAERLAQIGGIPDGRVTAVSQTSSLEEIDYGLLEVDKTYQLMAEKVQEVSDRIKSVIEPVDEKCHVSGDILIAAAETLDKQAWLLRSATEGA
ncbi:DNA starvation/stationary phase protection protein [Actinomycetaceae bacterium WB03_NA08]|uniref:DNA starvation/stationary phase protection protein n=1 Tax=Scrofimicrobium canadense TaxID=2652290 RepID=A0A6N7VVJ8_9ACTO|nr:DNA starvation/stationary phase protection protein [Scrofimicrobium canadense]MSS85010.1 DNA starvation/stationary phase protection protein [Scrofimicrobium canadense]